MGWTTTTDDSVLIDITVTPLEGKCTFGAVSTPPAISPGQSFSITIPWSNTGSGTDRFEFTVSLVDPDTSIPIVSDLVITTGGIAVNVSQSLIATFTLPVSYAKPHVKVHVASQHETGFYV